MRIIILTAVLFCIISCQNSGKDSSVDIYLWYGLEQSFGHLGNPQRQINILGNINCDTGNYKVYYVLNGKVQIPITLGSDLHRLANKGDFNIDIDRNLLKEGRNSVQIIVIKNEKIIKKERVTINYNAKNKWPLPYSVDWSKVNRIQDAVDIVDGQWEKTGDGVRTVNRYYDRMFAFGDSTWKNYEVSTTVIFHDYTPPVKGPPTYNVSHAAIATLWPGHDVDSLQPDRKWHPLGATSEFRITDNYDSCRWRIFDGEHFYKEQEIKNYRSIKPTIKYRLKHRVQTLVGGKKLFSVKFWEADLPEPSEWDLQALKNNPFPASGSACLIAHNTDVTFGNIQVVRVEGK